MNIKLKRHILSQHLALQGDALDRALTALDSQKAEQLLGDNEISISGVISSDDDAKILIEWFDEAPTYPAQVRERLNQLDSEAEVVVRINSPGGNVFAAAEISALLADFAQSHTIRMEVTGMAFSAAAEMTLYSRNVVMTEAAQLMFHNPSIYYRYMGTADEIDKDVASALQLLRNMEQQSHERFSEKVGDSMSLEEVQALYDAETFFSPKQALAMGLVNEIKSLSTDAAEPAQTSLLAENKPPEASKPVVIDPPTEKEKATEVIPPAPVMVEEEAEVTESMPEAVRRPMARRVSKLPFMAAYHAATR